MAGADQVVVPIHHDRAHRHFAARAGARRLIERATHPEPITHSHSMVAGGLLEMS